MRGERGNDVIVFLVGNKSDLSDKRQVSTEEGERRAKELDCVFIESSAKTGHNVKSLFTRIAQSLPTNDVSTEEGTSTQLIDVKLNTNDNYGESSRCAC